MNEVEQSVIDEDELQRQLEEELANMNYQPDPDDLLERQSNYSIFNQSTTNFNAIDASMNNVDDYFRETNQAWKEFLTKQQREVNEVIPENWEDELQDLKNLNKEKLQIVKAPKTKTPSKIKVNNFQTEQTEVEQIYEDIEVEIENKPYLMPQLILSDDLLIQSYMNQQQQEKLENQILRSSEKLNNDKINISISQSFGKFDMEAEEIIGKKQDMLDRINIVSQGIKQMQEYEQEMDRLFMEREDKLSREIEEYSHKLKFIQKDMHPPLLPPYLTESDNPLKNKPVQKTPMPNAPMTDNFVKYRINFQSSLPNKINLSSVKILWSIEKQQEEEEKNRLEEQRIQREKNHMKLTDLLKFSKDIQNKQHSKKQNQNQQQPDQLLKLIQSNKQMVKSDLQNIKEKEIQLNVSIVGKDPKYYESSDNIFKFHQLKYHQELSSNLIKIIPSLEKSMPSLKESQDRKPKVSKDPKAKLKRRNGENFMDLPDMNQDDSQLSQALALHASDPIRTEKIEIKNEQFTNLELHPFKNYKNLMQLNLSMNKIVTIQGEIDCPFLNTLKLSDNIIKDIPTQLFTKCKNLKTLHMDINKLGKLQNLQHLSMLEELNVSNNQIQSLDGIQNLINLRRLNFSFNKLTSIETHLNNLTLIEYIELGKNFISNIDKFPSHKLLFLNELYLYSNQLVQVPKSFSMPQLKILNLNRNQDLHQLSIGYCPLLEQISASYCSLVQIKQLTGCPSLRELDISFNSINSLEAFIQMIRNNINLRMIRFSDNPFSINKDNQFSDIFKRKFVFLERVNGENVNQQSQSQNDSNQLNESTNWKRLDQNNNSATMLRQFITKIMSQKIRVTFFSTTFILRYMKNMLPLIMLKSLTSNPKSSYLQQHDIMLLYENHIYVQNLRKSVRIITSYIRKRKFKRKALIKKMQSHIGKICKIQALIRGHLARQKNQAIIARVKRDGPKKTKKYQQISKLQANIKGFLFRKRRIKALSKLKESKLSYEDDFEEFDADKFFGIKEEVLQNGLSLPQEQMMQQMIQMMAMQSQQVRQMKQPITQHTINDSSGVKFPPINQKNATQTNINELIKPKTMRNKGLNRPPSAGSSNAISEIDMNSDSKSLQNKANILMRKNNLMNQTNQFDNPHHMPSISNGNQSRFDDQSERQSMYSMNTNPFYPTQAQAYRQKVIEEKKRDFVKQQEVIDEWGFQNEETKKMFEARMKKKNHGKKKQLTADEKLQKFRAINKK
ncbi:adenylate cyclase [Stylonychia lemnae]|uniref:Adenylate cyclase n=1 Tax=Stylonychia lemnae TaxID=5949 RepID=A0A078A2D2_STYLE|nr:adenylate cyclase [Stylonychia lemnae]|eukprot:CDW74934.1 adenylate cyclase [Stylonychia lemnae]